VRNIRQVKVHGRDPGRSKEFANRLSAETGAEIILVDKPEEAARELDILITATNAREPVLRGDWLGEGQHLNLIGSNFLAKSEVDVDVFRKADRVVVDSKEQAKLEAGDFVAALDAGVIHWADVQELAPVLTGRYPGRESPKDVTVFKSLGLGIEDIALAVRIVELALQQGLGKEIL
jgi:ornithine cyclodeaminase/alanine dehydrogenase-like protein (mu-crystallin family)